MTDYLKSLWARLQVHWSAVGLAFIAALPTMLDYLGVIDLKPILTGLGLSDATAELVTNVLPFVLAFVRPLVAVTPVTDEE